MAAAVCFTPQTVSAAGSKNISTVTATTQKSRKLGWVREGGKWYYYRANGKIARGLVAYKHNWYYTDKQTGERVLSLIHIYGKPELKIAVDIEVVFHPQGPDSRRRICKTDKDQLVSGGSLHDLIRNIHTGLFQGEIQGDILKKSGRDRWNGLTQRRSHGDGIELRGRSPELDSKAAFLFIDQDLYRLDRVGSGESSGTVSYTHLDVYKRQGSDRGLSGGLYLEKPCGS